MPTVQVNIAQDGLNIETTSDERRIATTWLTVEAVSTERRIAQFGLLVEVYEAVTPPPSAVTSLFCQVM